MEDMEVVPDERSDEERRENISDIFLIREAAPEDVAVTCVLPSN